MWVSFLTDALMKKVVDGKFSVTIQSNTRRLVVT
jgi:hypothetical protein